MSDLRLITKTEWADATTKVIFDLCRKRESEGWAVRQITMTKTKQYGLVTNRWVRRLFGLYFGPTRDHGFWMRDEVEALIVFERPAEVTDE